MSRIINTLGDLRRGAFLADLEAELGTAVDAVRDLGPGANATVTITLKVTKPKDADDDLLVEVNDKIASKLPSRKAGRSIMFAGKDGSLVRHDPRQNELPLREVGKAAAAVN